MALGNGKSQQEPDRLQALRPGQDPAPTFPKRFFREATAAPQDGGFALLLDGRTARTPARQKLVLPTQALAEALAEEWTAVQDRIDPRVMPFTRLTNSVIDGVSQAKHDVLAEIVRYAASDLLIYRAVEPAELVRAQEALWDPIVAWSRDDLNAPLILAGGVMFVAQPESTLQRLEAAAHAMVGSASDAAFRLAALHVMTTLTGSALLALAIVAKRITVDQAWAAAHVDEDYQIAQWGEDAEGSERRARRWIDMRTAARMFQLCALG